MTRSTRRSAALASGVVFASVVFDSHAYAADPKRVFALLVAFAALVGTARSSFLRGERRVATLWGARLALGFVALSGLSVAWGLPSGLLDLATWIAAAAIGVAASRLGPAPTLRIARWVACGVAMATSTAVLFGFSLGARGFSLHAGQGNPNWLGLVLAASLPLVIETAWSLARRKKWAVWPVASCGLVTVVMIASLYLSHSRVAWVASVASLGAMGLAAVVRAVSSRRGRAALLLAFVGAIVVGLCVYSAYSRDGRSARRPVASVAQVPHEANDAEVSPFRSFAGRLWIWRHSATAARSTMPFGVGLGRFGFVYLRAQGDALGALRPSEAQRRFTNATTAHQEFLQIAIESGPLAALLFASALVVGAFELSRDRQFGGAGTLVAAAVCSLGDSPVRQPVVPLLVALALAIGTRRARSPCRGVAGSARLAWCTHVVTIVSMIAVAPLLYASTRSWLATRARIAASELSPEDRVTKLEHARKLDPSSSDVALDLGLCELVLGRPENALSSLTDADRLHADVATRVAIGNAHLALRDSASAVRAYESALSWSPGSVRAHTGLSQALLTSGALDEAERNAAIARRLAPSDARIQDLVDKIREAQMDAPDGARPFHEH